MTDKEWLNLYKQHMKELGTYKYDDVFIKREPFEEVKIVNPTVKDRHYKERDITPLPKPKRRLFKRLWSGTKRVLRKVTRSPIFSLIIIATPKPISTMLKWIKDRFKEPSTYQGITALAGAIGVSLSPDLWEAIASLGVAVIGLIQVIKKEKQEQLPE